MDTMDCNKILQPEFPGIGSAVLTDKELHMAAEGLAKACESVRTSPVHFKSTVRIETELLPCVVTLARGSTDDTPGELDEVTEQSSSDSDDGSHVHCHVQRSASQHMPEAYREIDAGTSSSGSANQADPQWIPCSCMVRKTPSQGML